MMTRKQLANRWGASTRTIDRRVRQGLIRWVDLTRGVGKRPQIRFLLKDVEEYERRAMMEPVGEAGREDRGVVNTIREGQLKKHRIDPEAQETGL